MKKNAKYLLLIFCAMLMVSEDIRSWGFFGHKRINRMAVFILPPEMISFYKNNIEFITEHSVDPDKRRYATKNEAPRHYIDIDHYTDNGENPFELVPRKWKEAVEKYSEDTLKAYGIVPWHINWMVYSLTEAFEKADVVRILDISADLGHYIADAHVPLHTTKNYNGQYTGQRGIHGFWESRLPELLAEEYDYLVGRAGYIENPLDYAWEAVEESHSHLDSVFLIEKRLSRNFPSDKKYVFEQRGQSTVRQYSKEFSLEYHRQLNGMVEERMRKSIIAVGSLWYTAWVNAGQPNLDKLLAESKIKVFRKEAEELNEKFSTGEEKGRKHDHDE